jgi:flagellar export protein FliJ
MTTPYAALLSVREVEEHQAEAAFAAASRDVDVLAALVQRLADARAAWLAGELGNAADTLRGLETAERAAERRLADAERVAAQARAALIDCQRQRKVVEELHVNALAVEARAGARREQMELDELGSRAARDFAAGGSR